MAVAQLRGVEFGERVPEDSTLWGWYPIPDGVFRFSHESNSQLALAALTDVTDWLGYENPASYLIGIGRLHKKIFERAKY